MPVNFDKYQRDLVSSWKEVVNEKNDTSWAVYGYENQSDFLELVASGNGLEDLADQFSISRIMYAFCRYQSTNSDLPKYFIINWQGEGAQPARKMACANHINDVAKFFRGANMTIEARNEDDVEPTSIIKKLERISIHSFNLRERSIVENVSPVGTNYKRIQPQKEIDVVKRETFWSKVQEEDNKRRLEEKKRLEEERLTREKMLVERQLDEASQEKITIIKSTKTEIKTEKDIRKEFDRSKIGVRSVADNQWIKVKGEEVEVENGQNNGSNVDEVKTSSYVKSRVESFKKAFEEGKPPIQAEKPLRKIRESVTLSKQNSNIESNGNKIQSMHQVTESSNQQPAQNSCDQLNDTFKAKVKIIDEIDQEVSEKKELKEIRNGAGKQTLEKEIQVLEKSKMDKELTPKSNLPSKTEQTLNVESNVITTPSPEPGLDHGDDNLNAEIHETEEELNDKQSEDILNAEELEDEEFDVYKMWKPSDLVFSSTNLESDENHYFTVKSSYLDTLEDIAEEGEENIEEEEEKPSEQTEEPEDESEAERKFLEEAEKRFPKSEYGLRARALYDYQAADETEITFDPDDIITHIEQVDVGWWQGMAPDGTYGLFPANYVQLIE